MKTMLALLFLMSGSAFAQSVVLEDAMDIYNSVTAQYVYSAGTGAAGIRVDYAPYNTEDMGDSANFTIKGLSFNKQTEEIVFDNGVNEYVCARLEQKRFIFKYKTLVETGNCKIENKVYNRQVVNTDGINTQTVKRTYRKISLIVINADQVATTNWNVQKWPTSN